MSVDECPTNVRVVTFDNAELPDLLRAAARWIEMHPNTMLWDLTTDINAPEAVAIYYQDPA